MFRQQFKYLLFPGLLLVFLLSSRWLYSQEAHLLSATLVGVVTNATTGNPIIGAHIVMNTANTRSVSSGIYNLNIDPTGTYTILCSKAGFVTFTSSPITFHPGAIITLNIQLWETPNPSPLMRTVRDTTTQLISLSWDKPTGSYELIYDDGIQDNFTVWAEAGNMNAEKFTPIGYPALITGCSVNLGKTADYPPGSNPLVPFQLMIMDASGSGGTPGNILAGPFDVIPTSLGWVDFSFPATVTLASGSFFVTMIQGGNTPNAAGIAIDETQPQWRSYFRFVSGNSPWLPASGNFLLRAIVSGPGGPADIPGDEQGITGYRIWRLHQGEEMNPQVWTQVGFVTGNETTDNSWPSLPCGPHRWGVEVQYTGSRWSPATFSNVLGKCWTAPVTINLNLSCTLANPAGASISLKNQVYQDTIYHAISDSTGHFLFPAVWKGAYEIHAEKFGYQDYTGNCSVNSPLSMDILLLQIKSPPTNLEVDNRSLLATWDVPFYSLPLLQENWSSGDFTTGEWIREGGSNWKISMTAGHPAPSAFFSWSPAVPDYNQSLTSRVMTGKNSEILTLKYDISLDNYSTSALDQMAIEIFDGNTWQTLKTWNNAGGNIPWTTDELDISAYTNSSFKIRFRSFGEDSYQINGWYIDNILVTAAESAHLLAPCIYGYNVYLDNTLLATVTENSFTLPGTAVKYDSSYYACVLAIYTSGYSDKNCSSFRSRFLWPPANLNAEAIESTVFLSWNKPRIPSDTGVIIPPGIMGYNIYRDGNLIIYLPGQDELSYYNTSLQPGSYSYTVDALYDLTPYGFPGQEDHSMKAGPVSVMVHYGRPLPFTEPWNQGSFSSNEWSLTDGSGNWFVSQDVGNPLPSACFSDLPEQVNYSFSLESPVLDATSNYCAKIWLDFDLKLLDKNPSGQEKMILEVYYNHVWHKKAEYTNSGGFNWTPWHIDISAVKGKGFRFRFRAAGINSTDISLWSLDNISVYAVCLPAINLTGEAWGNDIHLSWSPPQCNGGGWLLQEGFESSSFPPAGWSRVIYNTSATWSHTDVGSAVGVHTGNYSAGLLWDYNAQDEWIIARNVFVNGNLQFWSMAYQGSAHGDHYYVKVSTDHGNSWDVLFDLSTLPPFPGTGGYNQWQEPYTIDMSSYSDDIVDIAWHADDYNGQGLWYYWGIDDCTLGGKKLNLMYDPPLFDVYRQDPSGGDFTKANNQSLSDTAYLDPMLPSGLYHYYIQVAGDNCNEAIPSDTIGVDVITAIPDPPDKSLNIYPNPAHDFVMIRSDVPVDRLVLLDVMGRVVLDIPVKKLSETKLLLPELPAGLFLLEVFTQSNCRKIPLSVIR